MTTTIRMECGVDYLCHTGTINTIRKNDYILQILDCGYQTSLLGISSDNIRHQQILNDEQSLSGDDIPEPLRPYISEILFERS